MSDRLGARLGPRIAEVVTDAQAVHLRKTAHTRAAIEAEGKHIFWRDIAAERDAHLRPLLDLLTGHPDTHPAAEQMLQFMRSHKGELAGMLLNRTLGTAAATGVLAGISNLLAPINQRIIAAQPNTLLEPGQLALLVESRRLEQGDAEAEAARAGINGRRFRQLMELARAYPDFETALELWRRGLIGEADFLRVTQFGAIPEPYALAMRELKRIELLPADLALMVLRGIISADDGAVVAERTGLDRGDFELLTLATGEPPAAESMNEALRRGFIDDAEYEKAIRQSRIRDEWIPTMKRLRFAPMATADAVEAVVRNYITGDKGKEIAEQNGLEPAHWPILLEAHGRPPGLGQMLELWNRGEASQAQVEQAIRESDIKDKYVPVLRGLRYKIPPPRQMIELAESGAMPLHRVHELLEKDGYEPDVAAAFLAAAGAKRTAKHKQVALATVEQLYEAHAIDRARAEALIKALGYDAGDIPLIIASADLKRELKARDTAISAIRAGYLARHVDQAEAAGLLSAAGVPSDQAHQLLGLWAIELRAHRRTLTEAQIIHGLRQGHLTKSDAQTRLERIGYDQADAQFLIVTAGGIPKGA